MKTCLIYGHNGLDLDVTLNIRSFYKKLGFKVIFSDNLYPADLLVVLRAVDKEIDVTNYNFSLIHVYDYGGWDYDAFVRTIDQQITYIFCTSEAKKTRLTEVLKFPKEQVFIALPPVDISLWSKKLKPLEYDSVHIGNFKPITADDIYKTRFDEAISYFKPHIWGLGWLLSQNHYHGKAGVFHVSSIYAKSKFAFGLMYPFQRDVTFSGRFWQAPLNGCYILSEPGLYTQKIPGVIETDYSISDIIEKMSLILDREALQKESQDFWIKQNSLTSVYVIQTLVSIKNVFDLKKAFIFYVNFIHNYLTVIYQKTEFFKYLNKSNILFS